MKWETVHHYNFLIRYGSNKNVMYGYPIPLIHSQGLAPTIKYAAPLVYTLLVGLRIWIWEQAPHETEKCNECIIAQYRFHHWSLMNHGKGMQSY